MTDTVAGFVGAIIDTVTTIIPGWTIIVFGLIAISAAVMFFRKVKAGAR